MNRGEASVETENLSPRVARNQILPVTRMSLKENPKL